jgi:hypothetical protein
MAIDIHQLSSQLLERLANSIYDRDNNQKGFCFNTQELRVVEKWLTDTVQDILKDMGEY